MKLSIEEFSFSESNIQKIRTLNLKLKKEEERVRLFAEKLHDSLSDLLNKAIIDDFNFDRYLGVHSSDADCNKRNYVEEGDPIWEDNTYTLFLKDMTDDIFYTDNWNELSEDHILHNEVFCYTMHCICFHSHLTWQDIVDIDDVWIELKVDYQFLVEMKC